MTSKQYGCYSDICNAVADEIRSLLLDKPNALLCIAAGHTSGGVFEALIALWQSGSIDFSESSFIAMDEWTHMNAGTPGSCADYLNKSFLTHVNFRNVFLPDGQNDPIAECNKMMEFIKMHSEDNRIDYVVLGMGMNGHLALNEPGVDFSLHAHATELDALTVSIGQKYFSEPTALNGGITLGVADFLHAHRAVLIVSGDHKRDILKRLLSCAAPETDCPASALLLHKNAVLYYDDLAAR